MKNTFQTCAIIALSLQPLAALADSKQDCIVAGRVFQDAMRSETLLIAYGERIDWRRIDYYALPNKTQKRIENDVPQMRATIESAVADVKKDIPEWKRKGLDGDYMARKILLGGISDVGEEYAVRCLKAHQQDEAASSAGKQKGKGAR